MTARDRMVLLALAIAGVIAAAYFLVVTPERDKATQADAALSVAQARLSTALAQTRSARAAQSSFVSNVTAVNLLNRAVPPNDDVAALLKQLEQLAHRDGVDFRSLKTSQTSATPSPAAPATPVTPGAAAPATSTTLPSATYALDFTGDFLPLERFIGDVHDLAVVDGNGVRVTGRLVNITGVKLSPSSTAGTKMDAAVTAVDYTLPAGQSPAQVISALRALGGPAAAAQAALAQANAASGGASANPGATPGGTGP